MRSRIAVAVFAGLVAGGLAYGQPASAPPAAVPAVPHDTGVVPPAAAPVGAPCTDCGCGDGDCPHVCGPRGRVWAEADYLWWWMKGSPMPALVTSSTPNTAFGQAG